MTKTDNIDYFISHINDSDRIIGIDFGTKKIGIAVSDESNRIAVPLTTYMRINNKMDIKNIYYFFNKYNSHHCVMGYPNNSTSDTNKIICNFIDIFISKINKKAIYKKIFFLLYDEKFSTKIAKLFIPNKKNKPVDHIAATLILQEILKRRIGKNTN